MTNAQVALGWLLRHANMGQTPANEPPPEPLTFEAALKRLEEIVRLLEDGDIGLNEALDRYEEGAKLLRQSYELLQRAERRIELLSGVDADGNPVTKPCDDTATFSPQQPAKRRSGRRSVERKAPEGGGTDRPTGDPGMDEP
jgi:exodeoxyribonuclease VII small subunit